MKHKKSYDKSVYRSLVLISQFSINMLVPICMMTLLGWYLDKRLGTVYITIILFFVGAIAGAQSVYRLAKQIYSEEETKSKGVEDTKGAGSAESPSDEADVRTSQKQTVWKPKKTSGWKQK